ncbi:MAG: phosphoribosylanthranilate isomerase [Polyangiales bacterium]
MTRIKVCGLTRLGDALSCVDFGVDTLGINFWSGTKRRCDVGTAREIVKAVGDRAELVALFVDATEHEIRETLEATGIRWVQLHGSEPPELVAAFLPYAYKALRVKGSGIREEARAYPGEHLLLDAYVPGGVPGGTGHTFDWSLAEELARERKLTLAGGLVPSNVGEAIRRVRPYRVDVASGVESAPGIKDPELVRAFVEAVREADRALGGSPAR